MREDTREVLVLGLGNLIRGDDGLGVHAVRMLQKDRRVPPGIDIMDGGTLGLDLLPHVSGTRKLLLIDAVDADEVPGTIVRLEGRALERLPGKASVHQLAFADLLTALKLLGESPETAVLFGVQPLSTEWATELSLPVQDSMERLMDLVVAQLAAWERESAGSIQ